MKVSIYVIQIEEHHFWFGSVVTISLFSANNNNKSIGHKCDNIFNNGPSEIF